MKIQILGKGCQRCLKLEKNIEIALKNIGIEAEVEKIKDVNKIVEMGVMITPGLAINGLVKSSGKVLSVDEIEKIIKESM